MSRINYRRKDWKIKVKKPVSIKQPKCVESDKSDRHKIKQDIREILKEVNSETSTK